MKRTYIIPTTESMAFHAGSICDASGDAGTGSNVTTNLPGVGTGGGQEIGNPD